MKNKEAYDVLNRLFEERGWRGDLIQGVNELLTKGTQISTTVKHGVQTDLDRLAFEIPFQRLMVKAGTNDDELKAAIAEKEAWELVLKLSEEAVNAPDPNTLLTAKRNLILSQILRESIEPHEVDKIKQNLEDERREAEFVKVLIGEDTEAYRAVLNEISEWEKLLTAAS